MAEPLVRDRGRCLVKGCHELDWESGFCKDHLFIRDEPETPAEQQARVESEFLLDLEMARIALEFEREFADEYNAREC